MLKIMPKFKVFVLALIVSLGISKPASAGPVDDFLSLINQELNSVKEFFNKLKTEIGDLGQELGITITGISGDLGIIDLEATENEIKEQLDNNNDLANLETVKAIVETNTIVAHADSIVGVEGQELAQKKQEEIDNSVKLVQALENQANNREITQEVLKDISAQNSQLAAINSSVFNSLEDLRQTTAYNNRALARQLKQQAAAKNQEKQEKMTLLNGELTAIAMLQDTLTPRQPCETNQTERFDRQIVEGKTTIVRTCVTSQDPKN